MNTVLDLFNAPWLQVLGYTLLHSIWQALIVSAIIFITLRFVPLRLSNVRYVIASLGLFMILSLSIATFCYLYTTSGSFPLTLTALDYAKGPGQTEPSAVPEVVGYFTQAKHFIQSLLPLFLIIWIIGTLIFSLRIMTGLLYVEKLKGGASLLQNDWSDYIQKLAEQLKVRRLVLLAESTAIQAPVIVGYLKPMILIPVGMCSSLSTEQLETIFLHEMMHIRRKDYMVNLIQISVEAVYFFNPFVWIISGIMKREREHCCDDAVVQIHGNAAEYAHALATLEELRLTKVGLSLSLAEDKNQLLHRIKRLMEKSVKNYSGRERVIPALLLIIGLVCASWISTQTGRKESSFNAAFAMADTVKKQKKNKDKKEEAKAKENAVAVEKKNEKQEKKEKQEKEEDDVLTSHPLPPNPALGLAMPPISDMEIMPALPPPGLNLMLEDFQRHEFFRRNGEDWDAFSKEFQERFRSNFGDFYEKHEKEIQKMMEDAQEKINRKFDKDWEVKMEEFGSQQEEQVKNFAEVWAKQDEAFRKSAEKFREHAEELRRLADDDFRKSVKKMEIDRGHQIEAFERSHRAFEKSMKAFEEKFKNVEEATSELIEDGYLDKDEKIERIRRDNNSIEINGKKIKPEHEEKYNDLLFGC